MTKFDAVEYLDSDEAIAAYLQSASERGDEQHYRNALARAMKADAINQLSVKTGIDRQDVFEMFAKETIFPDPVIVHKVTAAYGMPVLAQVSH